MWVRGPPRALEEFQVEMLPSSNRQDARFSAGERGFESLREYCVIFSLSYDRGGHHAGVSKEMFVRAELSRVQEGGINRMQSWIPEKIAVVGRIVDLKDDETGEWTRGWTVESVAGPAIAINAVRKSSRDHLKMRKASDI